MSGAGRDAMNAGTSGSASMGDRGLGSAEVHSGLHSGGSDQYSGLQFATEGQGGGTGGRLRGAADTVRERVSSLAGDLGPRVRETASTVRERAGTVRERANTQLQRRGMLDRLRDNPLPVLGVAFAVGFLLAGNDDDDYEESRGNQARRELRSALMAGLSAGVAQGVRGFLNQAGDQSTGFVNTLLDAVTSQFGGGAGQGGESQSGGASMGADRGGSTGGTTGGTTGAGRTGAYAGGGTTGSTQRPPSHQEY